MPKKLTQAEFLAKAVAVHGVGRYDYSRVVYVGDGCNIIIACIKHGVFEQKAGRHSAGAGCSKCGNIITANSKKRELDYFILRAQKVHANKYDYSEVKYVSHGSHVKIICPIHGAFEQSMGNHISNARGCPACGKAKQTQSATELTLDTEGFIKKSVARHGSRYDYSQSMCQGRARKVKIICRLHGAFYQMAFRHYSGSGCRVCAGEDSAKRNSTDWVARAQGKVAILYFLRIFSDTEEFYKVGITYQSIVERYRSKSSLGGYGYEVVAEHKSADALAVFEWERAILDTFPHLSYWPTKHFPGATECFSSADEILAIFPL